MKDSTTGHFCPIGVSDVEGLVGGLRLLLVAVGTAPREVVAFLEEESVAMNRVKIHLGHQ